MQTKARLLISSVFSQFLVISASLFRFTEIAVIQCIDKLTGFQHSSYEV